MFRNTWRATLPTGRFLPLIMVLALAGCATVDPVADYDRARDLTSATVAVEPAIVGGPQEEQKVTEQIQSRLQGGLSSAEAVEIALLNNNKLEAAFYEIGVSRADLVQSGLLANPSLGAVLRFPKDGGDPTLEARLALNLMDIWHRPARKRAQELRLESTILQVAHDAALLAASTKSAYIAAVAAKQSREIEQMNLDSTEELLEITKARQSAGATTVAATNTAKAEYLEQATILRAAELVEIETKVHLAGFLGLDISPDDLELTDLLAPPANLQFDLADLNTIAGSSRLDLWAAKENVRAHEAFISLEKRLLFRNVQGSIEMEAKGGEYEVGPGIDLELPLFDQNRAQISKAEIRHLQAVTSLKEIQLIARQEVRIAYGRLLTTLGTEYSYRTSIIPLRESSLELARESFLAGKSGFLGVLEAQKQLLKARRKGNTWAEASLLMVISLEEACGRPLDELQVKREENYQLNSELP